MRSGRRVVIPDVMADELFAPYRGIAAASGYRAVQTTPLLGAGGRLLGMMSTHWAQPQRPSARVERMTDLYARQVADFTDRKRAEAALRESQQSLRARPTAARTSSWPCWRTSCATRWRRSATRCSPALKVPGRPRAGERAQEMIERQVAAHARLLDDLLDVSRITRGKLELRARALSTSAIVVDAAVETPRR